MRFLWLFDIGDKDTRICWSTSISNRMLSTVLGFGQLIVAVISLYQHVYSITVHRHIFHCQSNISTDATLGQRFLAYDMIIFDFGLMHRILGTTECIANYLDGGYMRAMWCCEHVGALLIMFIALYVYTKTTWLLWPALLIQSSYALGLAILTMATAPKLLDVLGGAISDDPLIVYRIGIFACGIVLNWLLTLTLWHHYWYIDDHVNEIEHI